MGKSRLQEIFSEELVVLDHAPFEDKKEAFSFMAELFLNARCITDKEKYIAALNYRETLGSTYMGSYLAIPHGKCKEVTKSAMAFCRCSEPFIYHSEDEEGEVKYIFALAIEEQQHSEEYLKVLAELAGLLADENFIEIVAKAQSSKDIADGLQKIEIEMEE